MSIIDACERNWAAMSPTSRLQLLNQMSADSPLWEAQGKSNSVLSYTDDYNDLPSDIRGRLILALSEESLSFGRYVADRKKYLEVVRA